MFKFREINIEYKSTVLFGACALLLSICIGIIAGISPGTVALRTAVLTIFFSGIGFGIIFVIKKFVPEVYELIISFQGGKENINRGDDLDSHADDDAETPADAAVDEEDIREIPISKETEGERVEHLDSEFKELDKNKMTHLSSKTAETGDSVNTREGKLGKHIIAKEKLSLYEPKIMAQAVRTMMSKDKD